MRRSPNCRWILTALLVWAIWVTVVGAQNITEPILVASGQLLQGVENLSQAPTVYILMPEEVQKAAVQNSGIAAALLREACANKKSSSCLSCFRNTTSSEISATLLAYAADEVRNQSAGLALVGYYRLAEIRGQLILLHKGLQLIDELIRKAEELRQKGLKTPEDYRSLLRQKNDQTTKSIELSILREKLNEQLRQLFQPTLPSSTAIQTIETFHLRNDAPDEESAVQKGKKYRADLNLLRTAANNLDARTLPVIRHVLVSSHGMLAKPRTSRCVPYIDCVVSFVPALAEKEVSRAKEQLREILKERERMAEVEIRSTVREVNRRYELVNLAQERAQLLRSEIAELTEKERKGMNVATSLAIAQGEEVKAEIQVLHQIIEWELARVKLRQFQGLLVREVLGCERGNPSQTNSVSTR